MCMSVTPALASPRQEYLDKLADQPVPQSKFKDLDSNQTEADLSQASEC